jgi:uroporphyrinogen-III decarboxylase
MTTSVIEIRVPVEEIEARRLRVQAAQQFQPVDRVPVILSINYGYLLRQIGVGFGEYYSDPEVMLRAQLMAQKWLLENVKSDQHAITGPWLAAWTDFQNASEPSALGCEAIFRDDDIVWAVGDWVKDEGDLRRLEGMDVINNGLHGLSIRYRQEMMRLAEKYPVRFQGSPVFYPAANPSLTYTTDGPFTNAAVLMGPTEIMIAVLERPDFVKELLAIVTDKIMQWLDFSWQELGLTHRDLAFADDSVQALSPQLYEEIVLPYHKKLRDHFSGRCTFHMCGRTEHLWRYFIEHLRIHEFSGFGWQIDKDKLAHVMGGRVVLTGNVSPINILSGTPASVKEEALQALEVFAPCRGYILADGASIAPGSPLENVNAIQEAAVEYGLA